MNSKYLIKSILFVTSIFLFGLFFALGTLCVMQNYFYDFFTHFFRFLESRGVTTTVIILMSGGSLIGGLLTYWLYEKL